MDHRRLARLAAASTQASRRAAIRHNPVRPHTPPTATRLRPCSTGTDKSEIMCDVARTESFDTRWSLSGGDTVAVEPDAGPERTFRLPWAAVHVALFLAEVLLAAAVGVWISGWTACCPEAAVTSNGRVAPTRHNSSCHRGRRLVATDFTSEFSRRLLFHKWVEDDVVLDRKGFGQYLSDAQGSAGLSSKSRAGIPSAPLTLQEITRQLGTEGLLVDASYAAEAHHMLSAQPRSRGRDEFMVAVRSGLRPHHYYLEIGCGGLAAGRHVMRFLLRGRYFCIEKSEYLLRAAVEYEVPAAGLIHKRPRFLLNGDVNVGALLERPTPWVSEAPSLFDFVVLRPTWPADKLERAIRTVSRYLRPRSGRLTLGVKLPDHLQQQLGLQLLEELALRTDPAGMCPFSSNGCAPTYVYHT